MSQPQLIDFEKEMENYKDKYYRYIPTIDYEYLHCIFHPESTDYMIALGRIIVHPDVRIYEYKDQEDDTFLKTEGEQDPFNYEYEICHWQIDNTICPMKKAHYQFYGRPVNDAFYISRDKKGLFFFLKQQTDKNLQPTLLSMVLLDLETLNVKESIDLTQFNIKESDLYDTVLLQQGKMLYLETIDNFLWLEGNKEVMKINARMKYTQNSQEYFLNKIMFYKDDVTNGYAVFQENYEKYMIKKFENLNQLLNNNVEPLKQIIPSITYYASKEQKIKLCFWATEDLEKYIYVYQLAKEPILQIYQISDGSLVKRDDQQNNAWRNYLYKNYNAHQLFRPKIVGSILRFQDPQAYDELQLYDCRFFSEGENLKFKVLSFKYSPQITCMTIQIQQISEVNQFINICSSNVQGKK